MLAWMMFPYLGIFVRTANSEMSDALLSLMLKPFMGTCVNMRNTENSEIRILLYKQPPNFAHTMTYVSTYSRHKHGKTWYVKCPMNCKSRNIIYILICAKCRSFYVGQTENLRQRVTLHRQQINHEEYSH